MQLDDSRFKHKFAHYYSQARQNIEDKDLSQALNKLMLLDKDIQALQPNEYFTYQSFDSGIEYATAFIRKLKEDKDEEGFGLERTELPISWVYIYISYCFIEMKKYTEAVQALNEALKWNTMSSHAYYELAFINQWILKNNFHALELSKKGLINSYTERDRAKGYRHVGAALIDLNKLEYAEAVYIKSLDLIPMNTNALDQLEYIQSLNKDLKGEKSIQECDELLEEINIPVSVDETFYKGNDLMLKIPEEFQ
jgi:tetratricopeptide (TPR) repeat protein